MQDVDEWLIMDGTEFSMNDDEIVPSVLHNFNNTPSLEEIERTRRKNLFWYCFFGITNKSKFFRETSECTFTRVNNNGTQVVQHWHNFAGKENQQPKQNFWPNFSQKNDLFYVLVLSSRSKSIDLTENWFADSKKNHIFTKFYLRQRISKENLW